MTLSRRSLLLGLLVVAVLQTGVLIAMVGDRMMLLSRGREIVLPIIPVDPRDLFRGEYVRLSYPISQLDAALLEGPPPAATAPFYLTLAQAQGGEWSPVGISASRPKAGAPDRVVLAGRAEGGGIRAFGNRSGMVWARYGIESYFVPEGQGRELETMARDRRLSARIAVGSNGRAALKGLMIDGKDVYSEPLF
jgi:uncharacterized membrane-anchored protein